MVGDTASAAFTGVESFHAGLLSPPRAGLFPKGRPFGAVVRPRIGHREGTPRGADGLHGVGERGAGPGGGTGELLFMCTPVPTRGP